MRVTSADGAVLHVRVDGPAAAPPVVLAHGWTCGTAFWQPVTDGLRAAGLRVIRYDQRGHGDSPDARTVGVPQLADDLCAVLDASLAPGERAVVAGHSMGAMAVVAAAGRPELARHAAAVLLCSTGMSRLVARARIVPFGPARLRTALQARLLGTSAPYGPVTPVSRALLRYVTMGRTATREQRELVTRVVHACPRRVRARWAAVLGSLELSDQVRRLTVPTAVVAGTADRLTPIGHARDLAAALPQRTDLTELAGVGHMTPVEAADVLTDALTGLARTHLPARSFRETA